MAVTQEERNKLKRRYLRERGYFADWNEVLLENDENLLEDVMTFARSCEGVGHISEKLRHLIWLALDAAITHIFPFGIALHARLARACGASDAEIFETLRIGCAVNADVTRALAIVAAVSGADAGEGVREYRRCAARLGGGDLDAPALDPKSRALVFLGMYASTALFEAAEVERHVAQALAAGATGEELAETVTIASGIGIHGLVAAVSLVAPADSATGV